MTKNYLKTIQEENRKLQEQMALLKAEIQEKSRELMKEAFREFFEKYDDVVDHIFWTQYAPYFNDGEECIFSVNDIWCVLKKDIENPDEDYDEYEGSRLYSKEDIISFKEDIKAYIEWEINPHETVRKYQFEYIKKYGRDPFEVKSWERKTADEKMKEWRPSYISRERLEEHLSNAENQFEKTPELYNDFRALKSAINDINQDLMKVIFGDHVKVIVTKEGIDVEEYEHD